MYMCMYMHMYMHMYMCACMAGDTCAQVQSAASD